MSYISDHSPSTGLRL